MHDLCGHLLDHDFIWFCVHVHAAQKILLMLDLFRVHICCGVDFIGDNFGFGFGCRLKQSIWGVLGGDMASRRFEC